MFTNPVDFVYLSFTQVVPLERCFVQGKCSKQVVRSRMCFSQNVWKREMFLFLTNGNTAALLSIALFLFTASTTFEVENIKLYCEMLETAERDIFTFVGWRGLNFSCSTTLRIIAFASKPHFTVNSFMLQHIHYIIEQLPTVAAYQNIWIA